MMNKRRQTKGIVEVVLILGVFFALTILGFVGYFLYNAVTQKRSTYSIVAIDPVTGDVGIAGASCVPISAGGMTTFVPGMGAAKYSYSSSSNDNINRDPGSRESEFDKRPWCKFHIGRLPFGHWTDHRVIFVAIHTGSQT